VPIVLMCNNIVMYATSIVNSFLVGMLERRPSNFSLLVIGIFFFSNHIVKQFLERSITRRRFYRNMVCAWFYWGQLGFINRSCAGVCMNSFRSWA
jgi:hypothetical protein